MHCICHASLTQQDDPACLSKRLAALIVETCALGIHLLATETTSIKFSHLCRHQTTGCGSSDDDDAATAAAAEKDKVLAHPTLHKGGWKPGVPTRRLEEPACRQGQWPGSRSQACILRDPILRFQSASPLAGPVYAPPICRLVSIGKTARMVSGYMLYIVRREWYSIVCYV